MSDRYSANDHYLDPVTGILRNKLGLTDEKTLSDAEADLAAWRVLSLRKSPLHGNFDFTHLKEVHGYLFQDVYEWAGEIRNINISKNNSMFAAFNHIEAAAQPIFAELTKENLLVGLDTKAFSERSAYYLSEINALHPFREGNGRAQREFINHLAYKSGFVIEWERASPEDILDTAIRSFNGDVSGLESLILKFLVRRS